MEVFLPKADPIGAQRVPDLALLFVRPLADYSLPDTLEAQRKLGRDLAEAIVAAMRSCVPGFLVDAILVELLHAKASDFRVPLAG